MKSIEYTKDETKSVYKIIVNDDDTMESFVFNGKEWVSVPFGHVVQAQWNGRKIDEKEAMRLIEEQKKPTP